MINHITLLVCMSKRTEQTYEIECFIPGSDLSGKVVDKPVQTRSLISALPCSSCRLQYDFSSLYLYL